MYKAEEHFSKLRKKNQKSKINKQILRIAQTLFAHLSPHALHRVLGPAGPRRIIGVDFELIPQCLHLHIAAPKIKMYLRTQVQQKGEKDNTCKHTRCP